MMSPTPNDNTVSGVEALARPSGQALVSDQAPTGLAPSGFDPSRGGGAKPTPGPWSFRQIGDDGLGYIEADGRDVMHAGVSDRPASENVANSILTAAAPELLEALEAAVNRVRERQAMRAGMPGDTNEILAIELACMVAALEEIAAPAVNKARGL